MLQYSTLVFQPDSNNLSDIANTHLHTGRERDPETGLQLNRHRYYASHLGRWLTRDPIGYMEANGTCTIMSEIVPSLPPIHPGSYVVTTIQARKMTLGGVALSRVVRRDARVRKDVKPEIVLIKR